MLMKKALLIGLALGLVVAGAVPALAVDLTASGFIGVAGTLFRNANAGPGMAFYVAPGYYPGTIPVLNVPFPSPASAFTPNDEMGSTLTGRAELQFMVQASEDLYGVFKFRMASEGANRWGTAGNWGQEGGSSISVAVQHLYMDFRVPPKLPLWFRIGLQNIFIRGWTFMCEDVPAVSARVMIDPIKLSVTGYFAKLIDASATEATTGAEFYAVDAKIPLSFGSVNIAPGMFFAYQNERWALNVPDPDAQKLWWLGVNVDGGIGPVNMQVDFIYNGGTLENTTIPDQDYGSWLVCGQVSFVWQKLQVGVGGRYTKGENVENNDIESFQLPGSGGYNSESMAVSGDFVVFDNGWMMPGPGWPANIGLIDGPNNFWFGYWDIRGFVYYNIFDWLKVGAQVGYIGDTVSGVAGGVGGDAIGTDADDDDSIGWEMDFGVNVQIYQNLALHTAFGYLFANKALSQAGGVKPQDPWGWQSRIMYMF
jgi:hypothetical protein